MNLKIVKTALFDAVATGLYILLVGLFMYYGTLFKIGKNSAFLAPVALLLLFVSSASITGYLVLGKPALLYLDGKKKEALSLLTYTLIFLFLFTVLAIFVLIFLGK